MCKRILIGGSFREINQTDADYDELDYYYYITDIIGSDILGISYDKNGCLDKRIETHIHDIKYFGTYDLTSILKYLSYKGLDVIYGDDFFSFYMEKYDETSYINNKNPILNTKEEDKQLLEILTEIEGNH